MELFTQTLPQQITNSLQAEPITLTKWMCWFRQFYKNTDLLQIEKSKLFKLKAFLMWFMYFLLYWQCNFSFNEIATVRMLVCAFQSSIKSEYHDDLTSIQNIVILFCRWNLNNLHWHVYRCGSIQVILTYWGHNKMDAISQMTFSNAFSWMVHVYTFWLRFHWSLFPRINFTISHSRSWMLHHWSLGMDKWFFITL